MAQVQQRELNRIRKYGRSYVVALPHAVIERLGWNLNDVVSIDVVRGSLLLTKVQLPKVKDLVGQAEPA